MTLGMAWIRRVGSNRELVVATDSRLSGGEQWDAAPKLKAVARSDVLLAFAGNTKRAYPLLLQAENAITMYGPALDRSMDVHHLKGHLLRVFQHMSNYIGDLPTGQQLPEMDCEILICGYSWRQKEFRIWRIIYDQNRECFVDEHVKSWGKGRTKFIHFIGDNEAKVEAKRRLIDIIRANPELRTRDFDMEPFEVLRDIIRGGTIGTVGGAPQLAKVYEHMNVSPFAIYWPDAQAGQLTLLGRPLMEYEKPRWAALDPDRPVFEHEAAVTEE